MSLEGFIIITPTAFSKNEKEFLNKHLDVLQSIITKDDFIDKVMAEEDANGEIIAKLNLLSPQISYDLDELYPQEKEDYKDYFKLLGDNIKVARKFIENPYITGEDVCDREIQFIGKTYRIIFAGETTSERPEGKGYEMLDAIDKTGLFYQIESRIIPQTQSVHYLKELLESN